MQDAKYKIQQIEKEVWALFVRDDGEWAFVADYDSIAEAVWALDRYVSNDYPVHYYNENGSLLDTGTLDEFDPESVGEDDLSEPDGCEEHSKSTMLLNDFFRGRISAKDFLNDYVNLEEFDQVFNATSGERPGGDDLDIGQRIYMFGRL